MVFMILGYAALLGWFVAYRLEAGHDWIFLIIAGIMFITQLIENKFVLHALSEQEGTK